MPQITQAELKKCLAYNEKTGDFTWLFDSMGHKAGSRAGNPEPKKYIRIRIGTEIFGAHNLAWLYVYGTSPAIIDHINTDKNDNRLSNLREVTISQNNWNAKTSSRNSTGVKGINFVDVGGGHYLARVSAHGKRYTKTFALSRHHSEEAALDAATVWVQAKRKELHGDFANNG